MLNTKRFRFRIIVPAFTHYNIYTTIARTTTSVGPIYVATCANKLLNWDVEVIDETNCHGRFYPATPDGALDHERLQKERPADVVGFYASISSTVPHIYELARFYKSLGVKTVAGGKHVEHLIEEALSNNIDVVALKEGEITITELLVAWENESDLSDIKGIAFLKDNMSFKTEPRELIQDFDSMPLPDFKLLYYAKMKLYPIARTRGCNLNCEFCAVKDRTRSCSPQYMMKQVKYLVESQNARSFFEVSDHFASNRDDALEFCRLLAEYQAEYKIKLSFTVQTRLTDARYPELLEAMQKANIDVACIGFESPIDEDLIAMKKGYLSKDMIEWTNTFHRYGFYIHGMFIFGYPRIRDIGDIGDNVVPLEKKVEIFKEFIKKSNLDTVQVLLTIPLPGTQLRERLAKENRLFPLNKIGWEYYDGQFPIFMPDDGVTPEKLLQCTQEVMFKFYSFNNFWKIVNNVLINFPVIVLTSLITIFLGTIKYVTVAFELWHRRYFRNQAFRFGGYFIVKKWVKKFKEDDFLEKIRIAKDELIQRE
ncbi:MAG: B12-binding domain-containing radical SAM protein [Nitrospirae bacterium]|nr:B12-binding domain-containing radical SAM protein [Nitrospirota bacterium]